MKGFTNTPVKELNFGDLCPGWTAEAWAWELRRKAACCEESHPKQTDYYRRWAKKIEEMKIVSVKQG